VTELNNRGLPATHILGAQPVISALQHSIERRMRAPDGQGRKAEEEEWRYTLQKAFDATIDYSACPLLAQSIWHLCILADKKAGGPSPQDCRQDVRSQAARRGSSQLRAGQIA